MAGEIRACEPIPVQTLIDEHRAWWVEFYRKTFLCIPDNRLEIAENLQTLVDEQSDGVFKHAEDGRDAEFAGLRAMDGFVVSAKMRDGKVVWVNIVSEKGGPCVVVVPGWIEPPLTAGIANRQEMAKKIADGTFRIEMKPGEEITLAVKPEDLVAGVSGAPSISRNPFGVKKGRELPPGLFYD